MRTKTKKLGPSSALKHFVLIALTLLAIFPMYVMFTASFKSREEFVSSPLSLLGDRPNLDAYRQVFNDQFVVWVRNSILLTGVAVPLTVAIAALAAWGLSRWQFRGREPLLGVIVSLMVIPPAVLLVPLFTLGGLAGQISTYQWVILIRSEERRGGKEC